MKNIFEQSEIFGSLNRAVRVLDPKKYHDLYTLEATLNRAINITRHELRGTMEEIPFPQSPTLSRYFLDTTVEIFNTLARMPYDRSKSNRQLANDSGINERTVLVAESFLFSDPEIEDPFDPSTYLNLQYASDPELDKLDL